MANKRRSHGRYSNLRAEMARKKVSVSDIASAIGLERNAASHRLEGDIILRVDEAIMIHKNFFRELDFEYLFETEAVK